MHERKTDTQLQLEERMNELKEALKTVQLRSISYSSLYFRDKMLVDTFRLNQQIYMHLFGRKF